MLRRHITSDGGRILMRRLQFLHDEIDEDLDVYQFNDGKEVLLERCESPHLPEGPSPRRQRGVVDFSGQPSKGRPSPSISYRPGKSFKSSPDKASSPGAASTQADEAAAAEKAAAAEAAAFSPRKRMNKGLVDQFLGKCSGKCDLKVVVAMGHWSKEIDSHEANCIVVDTLKENGVNDIYCLPMSCGSRGFINSFRALYYGQDYDIIDLDVRSPGNDKVMNTVPMLINRTNNTAVIEAESIIGQHLLSTPLQGNSYGLGQALREAAEMGFRTIYVGLPAQAACIDGGIGMAQALSVDFYDVDGNELPHEGNVADRVASLSLDHIDNVMSDCKIIVACESTLPIHGESNSLNSLPASQRDVAIQNMNSLVEVVGRVCNNRSACIQPGSGCGGGAAYMLSVLLDTELKSGLAVVVDDEFESQIAKVDLLITGAYNVDVRNVGDIPVELSRMAQKYNTKTVVYTAQNSSGVADAPDVGMSCIVPIPEGNQITTDQDICNLLAKQVTRTVKMLRIGNEVKL
ncbi:glycerate kinase [Gregarina niphandrodes]|uniref:Glycerate kinase n=1 Tax=Gregarina niphandrodes TaxID=110365 RepID=A0A023B7Q8_GRENI|nr:glycerate kinase [Gregarina niphandrodes]EZG67672.1 glycerate kinase [Gregarina niphandrodes]|eukprot:XP_011130171.1 glycerate kinase [Gregarina niphandrodes]